MDEVELKFRLSGPEEQDRLRARLREIGARRERAEHEANRLYDDAAGSLAAASSILRLRVLDRGPRAKLTYKGPARFEGVVKSRREVEVAIADAEAMHELLEALGYRTTVIYEKVRETWRTDGVEVALDSLAFGTFCELEGPAEAIRSLASLLGLDDRHAELNGYPALMARYVRE